MNGKIFLHHTMYFMHYIYILPNKLVNLNILARYNVTNLSFDCNTETVSLTRGWGGSHGPGGENDATLRVRHLDY